MQKVNRGNIREGWFEREDVVYRVSGDKAATFLHGQLTNDIKGLKEREVNYNLFLTNKGRIVTDLFVARGTDEYYLMINHRLSSKIVDHLTKLAPLSRVELLDKSGQLSVLHLCGGEGLNSLVTSTVLSPWMPIRTNRLVFDGYDLVIPIEDKNEVMDRLSKGGFRRIEDDLVEVIRVEQGVCKVGVDATEENLPQEARLDHALHFDKGCYLGQETIARLHYRGHVNKILVGMKIDSKRPVAPGTKIYKEEKEIGKVTSCVFSPTLSRPLALGYIPYDLNREGQSLSIGPDLLTTHVMSLPINASTSLLKP